MKIQPFEELVAAKFRLIKPYFTNTRKRDTSVIDTIVLHWTAGASLSSDIKTLKQKNYGYHFLIDKSGRVYQGSPLNKVISHSGSSYGPNGKYVNGHSIGISFSMKGTEGASEFTNEMYNSCSELILNIKRSLPNLKYITGHHWVSPGRKIDPYTFDFLRLMNVLGSGFKLWKTGYSPFPDGLTDCKCIKKDTKGNCTKSSGRCKGVGNYGYSERNLSTEVSSLSFQSDLDTE